MESELSGAEESAPAATAEASPTLMDTLRRFEAAHMRGSLEEMRACFHDDAVIESVASGSRALGPDETAFALGEALRDGVYMVYGWQYEELSPDVVLSITRARHRASGRAVRDETVYRLISGRDGLMWRVRLFRSRSSALAAFAEHGPSLGLGG
jgi:ketosteroid isomerase-like protein